jgi:hypothetical protein
MLTRGLERRLRKLEGARKTGVFFLAWGRDYENIARTLAEAQRAGLIVRDDIVVRALWTGCDGVPPSRWIVGQPRDLGDQEDEALVAEMERRLIPENVAQDAHTATMEAKVREMSDSELFTTALGERVNRESSAGIGVLVLGDPLPPARKRVTKPCGGQG